MYLMNWWDLQSILSSNFSCYFKLKVLQVFLPMDGKSKAVNDNLLYFHQVCRNHLLDLHHTFHTFHTLFPSGSPVQRCTPYDRHSTVQTTQNWSPASVDKQQCIKFLLEGRGCGAGEGYIVQKPIWGCAAKIGSKISLLVYQ